MRMLMWTTLPLALLLGVVGCQGESTGPPAASRDQNTATPQTFQSLTNSDTQESTTQASTLPMSVPCGPLHGAPRFDKRHPSFVEWTHQGTHILFDDGTSVLIVDAEGSRVETVVDANPGYAFNYGIHADLSSDRLRLVYSSCEYRTEEVGWPARSDRERDHYHYEIATVALDGSEPKRITENNHIDHYPVWSPDMTHIAFLAGDDYMGGVEVLRVARSDGSHQREGVAIDPASLTPPLFVPPYVVTSLPPLWSPDGEHIAFFGYKPPREWPYEWPYDVPWGLYTVRSDGTGLTRISEHTGAASWSPDGRHIAVARIEGEEVVLSIIAPDGSEPRRLIKITDRETSFADPRAVGRFGRGSLGPVSWSPDGRHILYVCEVGICVVNLDGDLVGQSPPELFLEEGRPHAAWSPDGSRIAVRTPNLPHLHGYGSVVYPHAAGSAAVFTMAHDGSDVRVLVRRGRPSLVAANLRFRDETTDIASCRQGYVVPDPQQNSGMVQDCETLMGLRDTLAGNGTINWSQYTPIGEWDGVVLSGSPARVTGLNLSMPDLTIIYWEGLKGIDRIVSASGYALDGVLPAELADLEKLETLELAGNQLSGEIPPELFTMPSLRFLDLARNPLTGCFPYRTNEATVRWYSQEIRYCPP